MSDKKDTRNVLTLEVKKFILSEREKQKTITQIANSVYKEFSIRTSKSVIHRCFKKKDDILATITDGKSDCKQRKQYCIKQ